MGGRGSTSATGRGNFVDVFKNAGTLFIETDKLDPDAMNSFLSNVSEVLDDMGLPLDTVWAVSGSDSVKNQGKAAVDGRNELTLSNNFFSNMENAEAKATVGNTWTSNGEQMSYFAAAGIKGTATHEAGHLVENEIVNRQFANSSNLERAQAKKNGTVAKSIVKEAAKIYGSNPAISGYGSKNASEKVAEAFSDVYTNGSGAKGISKTIVDVAKNRLN